MYRTVRSLLLITVRGTGTGTCTGVVVSQQLCPARSFVTFRAASPAPLRHPYHSAQRPPAIFCILMMPDNHEGNYLGHIIQAVIESGCTEYIVYVIQGISRYFFKVHRDTSVPPTIKCYVLAPKSGQKFRAGNYYMGF